MTIYLKGGKFVPLAGGTLTGALTLPAGTEGSPALVIGSGVGFYNTGGTVLDMSIAGAVAMRMSANGWYLPKSTGLIELSSGGSLGWDNGIAGTGTTDIRLARDAAATLAQRNGTTQQIFRLYNTYTDESNYERLTLTGVAGTSVNITAETLGTGGDNLDIVLTPAGTGSVKIPVAGLALSGVNANFLLGTTGTSRLTFAGTLSVINKGASADLYFGESTDTGAYFFRGTGGVNVTGAFQVTEMTAPAAPATNSVRIYAEDNGAGKTRLMALFATGAAQQIAIEP